MQSWSGRIILLTLVYWCRAFPHQAEKDRSQSIELDAFGLPIECVVREFNFTATVTDRNGKKCQGVVKTKACFGSCESFEIGTFHYPYIVRVQPVCNYADTVTRLVRLRDCEPGADRNAAFYRFPEAKSCACQRCDPKKQTCAAAPNERSDMDEMMGDDGSDWTNDKDDTQPISPLFLGALGGRLRDIQDD